MSKPLVTRGIALCPSFFCCVKTLGYHTRGIVETAGYAAKTEFKIDNQSGRLINGREEALVPLSRMRQYNDGLIC